MTKFQAISHLIHAEYVRNGGDIKAAFDAICGAGSYDKLAHEVYVGLRAKAGK